MRYVLMMALSSAALAGPVLSQGIRDGDILMNAEQATAQLTGHVIEFYDGSKARYGADGSYSYSYSDELDPFTGRYEAGDAGEVCVTFDNGFARCDTYVVSRDQLVLIIEDGTRFPVRSRTPLSE